MKKYLSATLIVAMAIGLLYSGVEKASADTAEKGYVTVSTNANTELPPDVAEISIAVHTTDEKSLQKATDENKLISDKIYKELSAMISKDNGDYIKTTNFNASPVYSYKNEKKTLIKYEVSNNIIVRTKSIKDVGKIIDKSISLGATNINNLNFSVSSYDKQCNDLLAIAAQKAYTRAGILASGGGNTLNGIKNITGSCSTDSPRASYRMLTKNVMSAGSSMDKATEISSPIQVGAVKLFANINASYFVK